MTAASLDELIRTASVVVCCGSGGVGKTTTAATLGVAAALRGRRAVVVTIDPARRLAEALGMVGGLTNEPTRLQLPDDGGSGELWALMLDARATFDDLVRTYASTPTQAASILANGFYRNVSGAMSGTQEYMAGEKLYALVHDERFDLVVVDTPPTRRALDFLEAPARLTRFLDHRVARVMLAPARTSMRVMNLAAQPLLRTLGRVVGATALADAMAFLQAFEGMERGFRDRAHEVGVVLGSPDTRYVLVASPRHDTIDEARFFTDELHRRQRDVAAVVVNRVHPLFGPGTADDARRQGDAARTEGDTDVACLWDNLAELRCVAEAERAEMFPLRTAVRDAVWAEVPLLEHELTDLEGLMMLMMHLFAPSGTDG
jgi:anion-transporting  ArsA/GET3 family ATPase